MTQQTFESQRPKLVQVPLHVFTRGAERACCLTYFLTNKVITFCLIFARLYNHDTYKIKVGPTDGKCSANLRPVQRTGEEGRGEEGRGEEGGSKHYI